MHLKAQIHEWNNNSSEQLQTGNNLKHFLVAKRSHPKTGANPTQATDYYRGYAVGSASLLLNQE